MFWRGSPRKLLQHQKLLEGLILQCLLLGIGQPVMATALVGLSPSVPSISDLKKQLEKKATFEAAVSTCRANMESLGGQGASAELRALTARCMTLLKSRYNSVAFWRAGKQLFEAALAVADERLQQELQGFIAQCSEFLGEDAGPSSEQQPQATEQQQQQQRYLFEGQLGTAEEPAAAPRVGASLAGLLPPALAQQLLQQQEEGEGGAGLQPPSAEVLEAMQQELDAIAVRIMDETGQAAAASRAPPAAKKVVRALARDVLSAARLQELGGADVRCPVCMENLAEGDEVQVMPCRHIFHPPCLAPWLEQNNSCPTCRHELPTDDQQYERRKEQEALEAEERRGAENAVSHSEFLYI